MNGLLVLLYCIEILGALLCGVHSFPGTTEEPRNGTDQDTSATVASTSPTVLPSASSSMTSSSTSTQSPTTVTQPCKSPSNSPSPDIPDDLFYRQEFRPVLMVTGGLIIACSILLVSTLLLAWKVCQLSRRVRVLRNNEDFISDSEHLMETVKNNKSMSETDPQEASVLMADVGQTQEEMGNGGKVNEDGQMAEENEKEVGDGAKSEEASAKPETAAENSSSSKPQEEATYSKPTKAVAAPTSEGIEEPKDVK